MNRRPEVLAETYYLLQLLNWLGLTVDYQFIANPGYSRDRGAVSIFSVRAHLEGVASRSASRKD